MNCQADSTLTATFEDASATATIISNWVFLGLEFIGTGNKFRGYQQNSLTYTGSLSIDWGDGTIETMSSGRLAHEYSVSGTYIVRVSGNITAINQYDFYQMGNRGFNLEKVRIPNTLTSIGFRAFGMNTSLTSVTIPSNVTSMASVFWRSTGIIDFQLYWDNPPISWNGDNFPNNTDTYYTIPYGSTSNYVAKGFPSAKLIERSA